MEFHWASIRVLLSTCKLCLSSSVNQAIHPPNTFPWWAVLPQCSMPGSEAFSSCAHSLVLCEAWRILSILSPVTILLIRGASSPFWLQQHTLVCLGDFFYDAKLSFFRILIFVLCTKDLNIYYLDESCQEQQFWRQFVFLFFFLKYIFSVFSFWNSNILLNCFAWHSAISSKPLRSWSCLPIVSSLPISQDIDYIAPFPGDHDTYDSLCGKTLAPKLDCLSIMIYFSLRCMSVCMCGCMCGCVCVWMHMQVSVLSCGGWSQLKLS